MKTFAEKSENREIIFDKSNKRQNSSFDPGVWSAVSSPLSNFQIQRTADCVCGGGCPACQTKNSGLPISSPNDASEIEADATADRVMRMSGDKSSPLTQNQSHPVVQTKSKAEAAAGNEISAKIEPSGSDGKMDDATESFMQERFGADFGNIKIHTGGESAQMNRELNARAFTLGDNIYFNEGEYQPQTESGRHLLAHELAHTIQQQSGKINSAIQRKIQVNPGVTLDTMGYTVTKSGDTYTCPRIEQSLLYHEVFTSMLFSPRVFKLKGATDAEANASRREHMYARMGVVDFASKKEYSFGGLIPKMNPEFWRVDPLNGSVSLQPGVNLQEALEDLNVNPEEYAIGCQLATELTMLAGGQSPIKRAASGDDADWVPGDSGYIENKGFPASGGEIGTRGENIIYTGQDKFWGHFNPGLEYKTLPEWFALIKTWNNGTGRAELSSQRNYPSAGLE